ncbi:uncharacterized protein LOC115729239 [Rhodamnia argentea]|uniref:Uncharacterized protein LOC115729239 n=1 Tax=Rhodamnia argentea TaxID=178133 RepID=A0ABM3GRN5_9MYRT|nr:uncharacterized protein LOC115729239 [Rhodamnia argentea]XP_048127019.1 uncharacterized protein LOC115729239 [Rhodamnia argentea]XP_048127020.1 uncharacterized protein LOC115729239 [Rhodamnia argentea]
MEDRQLNYDQPLLSTRRFPSTPTFYGGAKDQRIRRDPLAKLPPLPPAYRSELKSGPISRPGTVPFTWERSPGRPKHERAMQIQTLRPPPASPKLSSGRPMNVKEQSLDKVCSSNRNFRSQRVNVLPNDASKGGEAVACEGSKKGVEEVSPVSEEGDEVYVDARDTLSRTESFFLNCSLSGVSGLDGPNIGVSGKFSTNPEMQDFMMDRFLPAAQAMAAETPPRPTRKQPLKREQPKFVERAINVVKQQREQHYRPTAISHYAPELIGVDSRGDDDDDDSEYDEPKKSSFKACGMLPRFCLKTFCLLNPVPSAKTRAAGHVSLARTVQTKPSHNASNNDKSSEHACNVVSNRRYVNRHQMPGIQDDKLVLKSRSSPINKITCGRESPRPDRSFESRKFQGVSSVHSKTESSHPILQEERFLFGNSSSTENSRVDDCIPPGKALPSFQEFLISEDNAGNTGFTAPFIEKTLYVDRVHIRSRDANTRSSNKTGKPDFKRDEFAADVMNYKLQEAPSVDFSAHEDEYSNALDERETLEHESRKSTDCISLFPHDRFNEDMQIDVNRPRRSSDTKMTYEVCGDGKSDLGSQFSSRSGDHTNSYDIGSDLHVPLPLPQCPSESWLTRTLPFTSSRNLPTRFSLGLLDPDGSKASNFCNISSKWETTVKTPDQMRGI